MKREIKFRGKSVYKGRRELSRTTNKTKNMKLCNIKIAKALQELGYNGEYNCWIDKDNGTVETESYYLYDWHIPCPRLDDAAYWLRERYGLCAVVQPTCDPRLFCVSMWDTELCMNLTHDEWKNFPSYESALEEAVKVGIERAKHIRNERMASLQKPKTQYIPTYENEG